MKVGVIGTGFIGLQHIRSWAKLGVDIHVFARSIPADTIRDATVTRHIDAESLIDAVDIVDVCTPTDAHLQFVLAAAAKGRHVICEKPIAVDLDEAAAMVEATELAGVRFFVAHVVRYFPEYSAVRSRVVAGDVGAVAVVRLAREAHRPNRSADNWIFDSRRSGGIIKDLMIHDIDYATWVAGPVIRVFARATRVFSTEFEDHAYAILTHRSGAISHLTASWAQVAPVFRTRIEVAGATGLLAFDSDDTKTLSASFYYEPVKAMGSGVGLPLSAIAEHDPFTRELQDFLSCIGPGATPRVTANDGIAALRVAVAAQESSSSAQPVEIVSGGTR